MKGIVCAAIFELLPDLLAHFDSKLGCDGNIAEIEEFMQVGSKKQSICGSVWTRLGKRLDMGGFQSRKRPLAGDGTSTSIGICD
jgi:hypothetical protein